MNKNTIPLHNLSLNTKAKINTLNCSDSIKRRLLDLGFIPNTTVTPVLISPSGDPIAYEVRGTIIALREEDSNSIEVSYN